MTRAARPGDILVEIGGVRYPARLTLAALAEIETALDASSFSELAERLGRARSSDLAAFAAAVLRAGGVDAAEERASALTPVEAARLVADVLEAAAP